MLTLLLNLWSAGEGVPAVDTVSGNRVPSAGAACGTSSSEVSDPPSEPSESERGMAGNYRKCKSSSWDSSEKGDVVFAKPGSLASYSVAARRGHDSQASSHHTRQAFHHFYYSD
jgi:hypothetical protein